MTAKDWREVLEVVEASTTYASVGEARFVTVIDATKFIALLRERIATTAMVESWVDE